MSTLVQSPQPQAEAASDRLLLLTGLLPSSLARRQSLPETNELSRILVSRWEKLQGRVWPWRLRESVSRLIRTQEDESRLVTAGEELLSLTENDLNAEGRGLRLEVNLTSRYEPLELYQSLLRGGAHSAFLRTKCEGEVSWSWPVRIGVAENSELLAGIGEHNSLRHLFESFNYERAAMRANLLLIEGTLSEVAARIEKMPRQPQADALVLFGGVGDLSIPGISLDKSLSLLWEHTGAQGIFIFDRLAHDRAQNFTEGLIAFLSHDLPLDSAVAKLAREGGAAVLSFATRSLVEATSVREQGRILARRLQRMRDVDIPIAGEGERKRGSPEAFIDRLTRGMPTFGLTPGSSGFSESIKAQDLGEELEKQLQVTTADDVERGGGPGAITFHRESEGARKLADLANAIDQGSAADAAQEDDRYLQARVETPAGRAIQGQVRLLHSRDYVASVFIGAPKSDFLKIDDSFPSPQPLDNNPILLEVLFWEPQACPKPQLAQLKLLPHGDTGIAEFPFQTTENQSIFAARIAIYHRNRNLQTGLLKGNVGSVPAELSFTLDAAPVPQFVGLTDRGGVGASIIVNDDPHGNIQATAYANGKAGVANVSDVKPSLAVDVDPTEGGGLAGLTTVLGRCITRITDNPDDYSDLSKDGTRVLLLELALHGNALLSKLKADTLMGDQFDRVDYIQIVSAHAEAFFPIEYLYDGEAPENKAGICSGAPPVNDVITSNPKSACEALTAGVCCGAYDKSPRYTICPLRFWSLSKVIERHAHNPEYTKLGSQFQLRSANVSARNRWLDPLSGGVLGASTAANLAVKDTVQNLIGKLNQVLRKQAVQATDWASWAKSIEETHPGLLVLLPHHLQEGGFDSLEIGGDQRRSMQFHAEHVRVMEDPTSHPIVLLIGCQTNATKIDLESFVGVFRRNGAVIIVSTIATILGRQAGPAAAAIVEEIKKQYENPNATFGDVMLAVRRRLLKEGTAMVLGLTSYGDADWRIGRGPNQVA
jgi:hypothetical protein